MLLIERTKCTEAVEYKSFGDIRKKYINTCCIFHLHSKFTLIAFLENFSRKRNNSGGCVAVKIITGITIKLVKRKRGKILAMKHGFVMFVKKIKLQ